MSTEEYWRTKSDDEVLAAASDLTGYSDAAREVILAEIGRRELSLNPAEPPKNCPHCGLVNPAPADACDCGYQFATGFVRPAVATPIYASRGQRFLAFLADLIVVYFTLVLAAVIGALFGFTPTDAQSTLLFYVVLVSYMVIAQGVYHTTVGKYVLGFEVRSDRSGEPYPTVRRLLIRETVGRLLSSLLWGWGYWRLKGSAQKQAWSDELARTIVCKRSTDAVLRKVLAGFVAVALVVTIGLVQLGESTIEQNRKREEVMTFFGNANKRAGEAREQATELMSRDTKTLEEWKSNMRQVLLQLDFYDIAIKDVQKMMSRAYAENLFASAAERQQFDVLREVYELRASQSAVNRREANLVISYDPKVTNPDALRRQLTMYDSDVESFDARAKTLLQKIGLGN